MWALSSSHRRCQVQATVQLLYQRPILGPFDLSVALRPQGPYRLLRTGSPRRPPRLSHSSWALSASWSSSSVLVYVHRDGTEYYCVRDEQARVGVGGGGGGGQDCHLYFHTGPELWARPSFTECPWVQSAVEWVCHSGTTFCPVTGSAECCWVGVSFRYDFLPCHWQCRVLLSGCVIQVWLSALSLAVQSVVEWVCHSGMTFCPVTGSVVTGTVQEPQLLKLHSARGRPQVQICCCE